MSAAEQLPLYPGVREPTVPTRASELDEQARRFLRDNPDVWRLFCEFADDAFEADEHIGAKSIVERIRWEVKVPMKGNPMRVGHGLRVRINNNHTACFARIYQATYPERAHVFETRERRSEERRARG